MFLEYEGRVGQLLEKGFDYKTIKERQKVVGFHTASMEDILNFCKTGIIYSPNSKPFYIVPEFNFAKGVKGNRLARLAASYSSQKEGDVVIAVRDPALGTLIAPTLNLKNDEIGTYVTFSRYDHLDYEAVESMEIIKPNKLLNRLKENSIKML
jgi:hypothetical protein